MLCPEAGSRWDATLWAVWADGAGFLGFLVSQAEGDPDGGQGELCHLARFKPSRPVAGEDGRLGGPLSF